MPDEFEAVSSPHIRGEETIDSIMWDVVLALLPVMIASVVFFGAAALLALLASTFAAFFCEAAVLKENRGGVRRFFGDGSAAVTGVLLGLSLPPIAGRTEYLWIPVLGSAVAILVGKHFFGGLGWNPFNPALVGRAVLTISFPELMANLWTVPGIDGFTSATPLRTGGGYTLLQKFIGNIPGCLGETSALAILLGGAYLMRKRHIDWRIPGGFLGTMAAVAALHTAGVRGIDAAFWGAAWREILFQWFSGAALLGAFFFATCYTTSPATPRGRLVYGAGCGLLVALVRYYGRLPEGVYVVLLLMNALTPLIDKYTVPTTFGGGDRTMNEKIGSITALLVAILLSAAALTGANTLVKRLAAGPASERAQIHLEELVAPFNRVIGGDGFLRSATEKGEYLKVFKGGELIGYIVQVSSEGYGYDDIVMLVGADTALAVTGVAVLEHDETRGVGDRAFAEDVLARFRGRSLAAGIDFDGVSGATRSSAGVRSGVEKALAMLAEVVRKGE